MIEAWTIGISLVTRSNFGLVTSRMGKDAELAQRKVDGVNTNLSRMPGAAKVASAALDALAVVAAATFVVGIKGASDMQTAIAGIAVATGQSTEAVAKQYTGLALAVSNATGVLSMADSMAVVQTLSTFVPDPKRLHDQSFVTEVAKFADIQKLRPQHSSDILESTADLGRVAHMLGAYSTAAITPVAERLTKLSFSTNEGLSPIVTQLGYFAEMYNRAGISHDQILNLAALGNLSLGHGKWGAGYNQMLKNIVAPTKPMVGAQEDLGIRDAHGKLVAGAFDSRGNLDFIAINKLIAESLKGRSNTDAIAALFRGFNVNAARLVALTSAPKNLQFYDAINRKMGHMGDIDHTQATLVNTLPGQTARLTTAFQSLATIIMTPLTNQLTKFIGRLADATQGLATYASQHPRQAAAAGVGVTALTGYLVWRAAAFTRLSIHGFTKGLGVYMTEGGKDIEKFEKSMVKALTNSIANIGKNTTDTITSKFVLPVLEQVNKLGPIGRSITNFALGIVADIGSVGGALGMLGSVLGKIAGAPLTAALMVLNPGTISDSHSKDGGIGDEGDPRYRARMAAGAARDAAYLKAHPRPGTAHGVTHVSMVFNYHAANGTSDATARRQALQHGRVVASQVAKVVASAGRTLARAAGETLHSTTMSQYETVGGVA